MSTALANPAEMIRKGAPHVIHSDKELAEYTKALFELTAKPDPTPEEKDAIELLTLLIRTLRDRAIPDPGRGTARCAAVSAGSERARATGHRIGAWQREHGITGSRWQAPVEP